VFAVTLLHDLDAPTPSPISVSEAGTDFQARFIVPVQE
jgi:hypothetical protein